jgi:hypothetical protein
MDFDINEAVAMLMAKNVDFELLHGDDYKGEVRRCIIAHFGHVSIRLNFGDAKHGNRVSRIHEADDHTKAIPPAYFKAVVAAHVVPNQWRAKTDELRNKVSYAI